MAHSLEYAAVTARIIIVFGSADLANRLVAGVPAGARAAREVASAVTACDPDSGWTADLRIMVAVPGGWQPTDWCRAEVDRLAPGLKVHFGDLDAIVAGADVLFFDGPELVSGGVQQDILTAGRVNLGGAGLMLSAPCSAEEDVARLDAAGRRVIAATAKPGDGIVSRHINRPISQAITKLALRIPGVTPFHATMATAALALAMAGCLFLGGASGLVAGALLFQAASIIDGVDGEIARATFRASARGALLDSMIDAATNIAFIAGVTTNFWLQGYTRAATAGAAGLAMLATGLYVLGRRARSGNAPFSFNAVKEHFSGRRSRLIQWLTWLTMRDFFALVGAILIMAGFGPHGLVVFAAVTAGWFVVVLTVLFRSRGT